jgi:uncharacterized surface protein with fasciclin (FAS1) repeats
LLISSSRSFFTLPGTLTESLSSINSTSTVAEQLGAGNSSLESTPQLTVFAPSNEALGDSSDFASLTGAHVIVGLVAYSPLLVDGAVFQSQAGTDLSITSNPDGTILVNDATIIQNDIVIENGVVHVIDKVRRPRVLVFLLAITLRVGPVPLPNFFSSLDFAWVQSQY